MLLINVKNVSVSKDFIQHIKIKCQQFLNWSISDKMLNLTIISLTGGHSEFHESHALCRKHNFCIMKKMKYDTICMN